MSAQVEPDMIDASACKAPKYFDVLGMLSIAIYLIAQISSTKLFAIGPFQFPGAIVVFPFAYIFGDVLTEVYGYARTRRVIWISFASASLLAIVLLIVQALPPAPGWNNQAAYEAVLGFVPRVVLGSILAFWAGEFVNSYVLAKMKLLTRGRWLWTRTIGSTVVGQAVDSIVFASIAFSGIVPASVLARIVISLYVAKVAYEVLITPVTYVIVGALKRAEGVDLYDVRTDFSPFQF